MAHIQNKNTHETEAKKDFKLGRADSVASNSSHGRPRTEVKHVETAKTEIAHLGESRGLEIAGLPWQLILVIGAIALGVFGIALKLLGVF